MLACFVVAVAACASPRPTRSSDPTLSLESIALPAELDRVLRAYEVAWRAGDVDALARLFTQDGFALSNQRPPVRGHAAIRTAYADAGGPLWLRATSFATDGGVGFLVGTYGYGDGKPANGKFVLALRRDGDGPWKIAADIENGNSPPRPRSESPPTPSPAGGDR